MLSFNWNSTVSHSIFFFQCHHISFCGLRGPPSWAWQECNRLLRLGRPWGAVTLSRWCISGDRGGCSVRRGLNLNSTNLPRPWSPRESSPSREIPTVEPGIELGTSWLVVRLWPLDHEAGHVGQFYKRDLTWTVKGKAVPLQAWSGPEDPRKLRFPDFMTTAQDRGKAVSLTHRPPLPPGNAPGTHSC